MSDNFYSASLSRTQGRNTWAIIFRHPKRTDPGTGKEGLRVRQSLKTDNESEAALLRDQMNVLLASPQLWSLGAREQALVSFDPRIVDIFFYKLEGAETDYLALREAVIALPPRQGGGHRRVLFLGASGAGKTTLLRQIIGIDPLQERFPATSRNKTTVHDTEVVLQQGPFRAVVTFFPMEEIREHLKECVSAAVLAACRSASDARQMRCLLQHANQRFHFHHLLGDGPVEETGDFDFDSEQESAGTSTSALLKRTNDVLLLALASIKAIAARGAQIDASDEKDRRIIDELFEEGLDERARDDPAFQHIIDALMHEIEERFTSLPDGKLQKTKGGWPLTWTCETPDRHAFIASMARFTSNHAPLFGMLLTPLVNGVRVAGPFHPAWTSGLPKLALLDGEGLGHTPHSMAVISNALSKRIAIVDAVILVDNAMQPMLAAPLAAMKELVSSGHCAKLIFAFTHFDQIKGDNLPTPSSCAQQVLAAAERALSSIGAELGSFAEQALRARLASHRVFLANLDRQQDEESGAGQRTIVELGKLLAMVDGIASHPVDMGAISAHPVYDRIDLGLNIECAITNFHRNWRSLLGLSAAQAGDKEHWIRIKALSRRFAMGDDHYDTLHPVADLRRQLRHRLYLMLQSPTGWDGPEPAADDQQRLFDAIAEDLDRRLLELAARRLKSERLTDWRDAYNESGPGATFRRAQHIADQVHALGAPLPGAMASPGRNLLLKEVAAAMQATLESAGARLN